MNRTLAHASLLLKDALRSKTQVSTCWSCAVTRKPSQRVQYHALKRPTTELLLPLRNTIRLLSTKRTKYSKEPRLLSTKKESYKQYPLLDGEHSPSIPRPLNEIQIEQREQRLKERVSIEEKRLSDILNKPRKQKSDFEPSEPPKSAAPRSSRIIPSPAQKGVYSPSILSQRKWALIVDSPAPKGKGKKSTVGRPKTKRQQEKAIYVDAQSLLKNYSPDFSVEWPEGVPLPPAIPHYRDTSRVPVKYPYFVRRTKTSNLPVYNVGKHGGSLQITQIHHVEGDPRGLLLELGKSLDVPLGKISYNPTTKRVIIRTGKMRDEVKEVLTRLGF